MPSKVLPKSRISGARVAAALTSSSVESPHLALLTFVVGEYVLALEADRIRTLRGLEDKTQELGELFEVDLHEAIGALPSRHQALIVAQSTVDPNQLVRFPVDSMARLSYQPLEHLRPLPPVIREHIRVDFLFGVMPVDRELALLIDSDALIAWARGRAKNG
jgi:hypothetical protein